MKRMFAVAAVVLFTGCEPTVKTISIEPQNTQLGAKGATVPLKATPKDAKGQVVAAPSAKIAWSSSAPTVVSVDAAGKVTALKSGDAVVTANVGAAKGSAKVGVAIPGGIEIEPKSLDLVGAGQTQVLKAAVKDDAGRPMPGAVAQWSSSDEAVVKVVNGQVTSAGAGSAEVVASVGSLKAGAKVTVNLPAFANVLVQPAAGAVKVGGTLQLKGSAIDAKKKPVAGVPLAWSSADAKIATVNSTGAVTGAKPGTVKISAKAGAKSAVATVTVKKK